jgi:hypothetical protein
MSRRKAASVARIGAPVAFDALVGFEADAALAVEACSGVALLERASGAPVELGPQATLAHEVKSNDRPSARAHVPMFIPRLMSGAELSMRHRAIGQGAGLHDGARHATLRGLLSRSRR